MEPFFYARGVFRASWLVRTMCRYWVRSLRPFSTNSNTPAGYDETLQVEEMMEVVEEFHVDVAEASARRKTPARNHSVDRSIRHYLYRDTFVRPSLVQQYHRFCDPDSGEEPKYFHSRPEARALAKNLKHELGLRDVSVFARSPPSVIGITENDVKEVVQRMKEAGFGSEDVELLLKYVPCTFTVDFHRLKESCTVMRKYGVEWRQMIRNGCGVFSLGPHVIEERLKALHDSGIRGRNLALLWHYPSVLMFPLSQRALEHIAEVRKFGFLKQQNRSVFAALVSPGALTRFGSDTKAIMNLLEHYDVTPDYILQRAPSFFSCTVAHLEAVVQVLVGGPFYMDSRLIKYFFISHPTWFIYVDPVKLQSRLNLLHDLFIGVCSSDNVLNIIFRSFHLLNTSKKVEENFSHLQNAGFSEEHLQTLCMAAPSVLYQDLENEVKPKLQLLLGIAGMDHKALVDVGYKYLLKKLDFLKFKLEFAQKHHPDRVHVSKLHELFANSEGIGDVNQLVDGSLPPARLREPQREGWRRKEGKSKATVKEGDKHEKPVAVEENSAVESLSRLPSPQGLSTHECEASTGLAFMVRSSDAATGTAVSDLGREKRRTGKSNRDEEPMCLSSSCSNSPTMKETEKVVVLTKRKDHKRKRRRQKGRTNATTGVVDEDEEAILEVLDDIL